MAGKAIILSHVYDAEGILWGVKDVRTTKYGFNLLFGSPVARPGVYERGNPRLIATQELVDFWEANRLKYGSVLFDLPAGRTTLKRLRSRLGFNYNNDRAAFWRERLEDLKTLSMSGFAKRHNVDPNVASDVRFKLLGRRARQLGWWRKPRFLKILRSGITLREMGEKLGISISHAKRIRDQALQEQ